MWSNDAKVNLFFRFGTILKGGCVLLLLFAVLTDTPSWVQAAPKTPSKTTVSPAVADKALEKAPSPEEIRANLDLFEEKGAWLALALEARKLEKIDPERTEYALFRAHAESGYVAGALHAASLLVKRLDERLIHGSLSSEWEARFVEIARFLRRWERSRPWAEKLGHWVRSNPTWHDLHFEWLRWLRWLQGEAAASEALERYEPDPKTFRYGLAYARFLHGDGLDGQAHMAVFDALATVAEDDLKARFEAAKTLLEIGSRRAATRLLDLLATAPGFSENVFDLARELPGLEKRAVELGSSSQAKTALRLAAGRYLVSVRRFTEAETLLKKLEGDDFDIRLARIELLRLLADSGADYNKRGAWIKQWGDEAKAALVLAASPEQHLRLMATFPQTRHKVSAQAKYLQILDKLLKESSFSMRDGLSLVEALLDAKRVDRVKELVQKAFLTTLSKLSKSSKKQPPNDRLIWLSAVFCTVKSHSVGLPTSDLFNQLKRELTSLVPAKNGRDLSEVELSTHFLAARLLHDLGDRQQARQRIESLVWLPEPAQKVKKDEKTEKDAPNPLPAYAPDPLDTALVLANLNRRYSLRPGWEDAIEDEKDFDRMILRWRLWLELGRIERAQHTHYLLRENLADAPAFARRLSAAFHATVAELSFTPRRTAVILDLGLMHLYHAVRLARKSPEWNRMEEIALLEKLQGDARIDDAKEDRRFRMALWTMDGELEEWIFKQFNLPSTPAASDPKPTFDHWEMYELVMRLDNPDYLDVLAGSTPAPENDPKKGWEIVQALGLRSAEHENTFRERLESWMDSTEDAELLLQAALLLDAMIDLEARHLDGFRETWEERNDRLEKAEKRLDTMTSEVTSKGKLWLERDLRVHDSGAETMTEQIKADTDALGLCFQKHGGGKAMEFRLDLTCDAEGLPDRLLFRDLEKDEYPVRTCVEALLRAKHFEHIEPPLGFTRLTLSWTPKGGDGQSLRFKSSVETIRKRLLKNAEDWKILLKSKETHLAELEELKKRLLDQAYGESFSPAAMSRFAHWLTMLSDSEVAGEKRTEAVWLGIVYCAFGAGLALALFVLLRRRRKKTPKAG